MAAPMVAGVAALMVSVNPNITAVDLRALLLQHAAAAPAAGRGRLRRRARLRARRDDRRRPRQHAAAAAADPARDGQGAADAVAGRRGRLHARRSAATASRLDRARSRAWRRAARRSRSTLPRRGTPCQVDALDASGRVARDRAGDGEPAARRQARRQAPEGGQRMIRLALAAVALALALPSPPGARTDDAHDERLERRPGRARRPRVLLPPQPSGRAALLARRRRDHAPGSPTPRAESSTPAWSAATSGPATRPAWC